MISKAWFRSFGRVTENSSLYCHISLKLQCKLCERTMFFSQKLVNSLTEWDSKEEAWKKLFDHKYIRRSRTEERTVWRWIIVNKWSKIKWRKKWESAKEKKEESKETKAEEEKTASWFLEPLCELIECLNLSLPRKRTKASEYLR